MNKFFTLSVTTFQAQPQHLRHAHFHLRLQYMDGSANCKMAVEMRRRRKAWLLGWRKNRIERAVSISHMH